MESTLTQNQQLIAEAYVTHRNIVLGYFRKRLVNDFEAEDLTQDVFARLVGYAGLLRPDTVPYFIFTIARNLSIDYNRRFFRKLDAVQHWKENRTEHDSTTEDTVSYNELACLEQQAIQRLPEQRGKVYRLSMHGDYTFKEMAEMLDISPRTVEKHLYAGRSDVRQYIAAVI